MEPLPLLGAFPPLPWQCPFTPSLCPQSSLPGLSVQQSLRNTCSAPAPTLKHRVTIPLPVSGQRAQPGIMVSTRASKEGLGRKRMGERERERMSSLKLEPRKWAGKRNEVDDREGGGGSSQLGASEGRLRGAHPSRQRP